MLKADISVAGHASWRASSAPAGWRGCQPLRGHPPEPWSPSQPSGQIGTGVSHKSYIYKKSADSGFSPEVRHGCVVGILL